MSNNNQDKEKEDLNNKVEGEEDGKLNGSNENSFDKSKSSDSSNSEKKINNNIDNIINNLGMHKYNIMMTVIQVLALVSTGMEDYRIYLLLDVLKDKFDITPALNSVVLSSSLLGVSIGAFVIGFITSKYGERWPFILNMLSMWIFGSITFLIDNLVWICFCRIIVGFNMGTCISYANTLFEILPSKERSIITAGIFGAFDIGTMFYCAVFYAFILSTPPVDCYVTIVLVTSTIMLLNFFLALIFYQDSPRKLLWSQKYELLFENIDKYAGSENFLSEEEKNYLVNTVNDKIKKDQEKKVDKNIGFWDKVGNAFSVNFKTFLLSIFLWIISVSLMFTGNYYLPKVLEEPQFKEIIREYESPSTPSFIKNLKKNHNGNTSRAIDPRLFVQLSSSNLESILFQCSLEDQSYLYKTTSSNEKSFVKSNSKLKTEVLKKKSENRKKNLTEERSLISLNAHLESNSSVNQQFIKSKNEKIRKSKTDLNTINNNNKSFSIKKVGKAISTGKKNKEPSLIKTKNNSKFSLNQAQAGTATSPTTAAPASPATAGTTPTTTPSTQAKATATSEYVPYGEKYIKIIISNIIGMTGQISFSLVAIFNFPRKYVLIFLMSLFVFATVMKVAFVVYVEYFSSILFIGIKVYSNYIRLYTFEAFHTDYRETVNIVANTCCRSVYIFMPFIMDGLFTYDIYSPAYFEIAFGGTGLILTLILDVDTPALDVDRDKSKEKKNDEEKEENDMDKENEKNGSDKDDDKDITDINENNDPEKKLIKNEDK